MEANVAPPSHAEYSTNASKMSKQAKPIVTKKVEGLRKEETQSRDKSPRSLTRGAQSSHVSKLVDDSYLRKAAEHAEAIGGKEWRRSKLMLVGEGRAGKTAFLNAMSGLNFEETASTVGIETRTCEVKITGLQSDDGGNWKSYNIQNVKHAELALAELAAALLHGGHSGVHPKGHPSESKETEERMYPRPLNHDLVVQLVKEGKATADSIIFSAWDYGGQEVFYALHHLFLSRFGVYLICFNMEWLVEGAPLSQVQQCLYYLNFWLKSIAVHTRDDKGEFAPFLLIGTHKDLVPSPEQHEAISRRLATELGKNQVFWASICKNDRGTVTSGRGQLWFFPVNNKIGRKDVVFKDIMDTVQTVVSKEEYLKQKVPFSWFKVYDSLQERAAQEAYLSRSELLDLACHCGLPSQRSPFSSAQQDIADEADSMLKFFNQLGILMYHHDEALRDTIVLDAASYLVAPATEIIRDHSMHQPHEQARKSPKWLKLMQDSVLDPSLLPLFWSKVDPEHHQILVQLLVKFGLFVPLLNDKNQSGVSLSYRDNLYLVPSLLKPASAADAHHLQLVPSEASERPRGFLIHFAVDSENTTQAVVDRAKLASGFLPNGLFGRVLGKCVAWSQSTSSFQSRVFQDKALLCWGDVLFTIELDQANHCIIVNIHPAKINPRLVMQRLRKLVQEVIQESMPHLQFCILLDAVHFRGPGYLMNLDRMGEVAQSLLTPEVQNQFRVWLPQQGIPSSYDVFVSSLLKGDDAAFSGKLFHCLSLSDNGVRPLEAFWDREYLLNGERKAVDPGHALCCSLVVVPLITPSALEAISSGHKEGQELLFEWVLALHLCQLGKIHIMGLVVDPNPSFSPLSPFNVNSALATVPDAPLSALVTVRISGFLKLQGLPSIEDLKSRSIQSIVKSILSSCIRAEKFLEERKERWERLSSSFVADLVSECVQPAVQKKLRQEAEAKITHQNSAKVLQYADIEWIEKVGAGIAGDVWRCRWHSTEVAVKVLKDQSIDKKNEFDKEVEVNTRLPFHERIVPMNGVILEPKCIVLKYLPRLSVDDYVLQGQRLLAPADFATTVGIAVDASAGITHLHEEGFIHRDISCRNFLLDDHLRAYVCDFGLSKFLPKDQLVGVGEVGEMIPLRWMAPEAIFHRHYNQATDIYMFGMFLYELFARTAPFRAELPGAANSILAKAIQAGNRPVLPGFWPKELQDIIRSCWGEDPRSRPTMARVNTRLTAFWESAKTTQLAVAPGLSLARASSQLAVQVDAPAYDGYVSDYSAYSAALTPLAKVAPLGTVEGSLLASTLFAGSVEGTGKWLREQGLEDMVSVFAQHNINGRLLSQLDASSLSLLGLTSLQCTRLLSKLPAAQDISLLQHIIELKVLISQQNDMLKQLLAQSISKPT